MGSKLNEQDSLYERMTVENRRFYGDNPELLGALIIFKTFKKKMKEEGRSTGKRPLKEFDDWLEARLETHEKMEDEGHQTRDGSTKEFDDLMNTQLQEYEQQMID